jgi:GNAT superfamily N-acetyltransferase
MVGGVDAIEVRECREADSIRALDLRNKVFPPIDVHHWKQSQTAAVAYLADRLVGVIPFEIREFEIAPDLRINAAFANSVAVADGFRGRGIGSQMMEAAFRFLPGWARATFVYTDHEREGPQYRFYRRCGYQDLLYPRRMHRTTVHSGERRAGSSEILPIEVAVSRESEILSVYRECYSRHAGTPARQPGYWAKALDSQIFQELPHEDFAISAIMESSELAAYAIAGLRTGQAIVLEWAARSEPAADRLWGGVGDLARTWKAEETVVYGQELTGPFPASLARAGFSADPREDVLVGRVISWVEMYADWWEARYAESPVSLEVWTPARDVRLGPGDGDSEIVLEMKEATLHQLLLGRIDLEGLVRNQWVTVRRGNWGRIEAISQTLAPSPWTYHRLDYL